MTQKLRLDCGNLFCKYNNFMEKNLREYTKLAKTSTQIMLAAIDNFNRVFSDYKNQTTFILITNAWELISKAILLKKRKNI